MTFTVVWENEAQDKLAQPWLDAVDRNAVSKAANRLDQRLRLSPLSEGQEHPEGLRIAVIDPLVAVFEVHEPDCLVRVLDVDRADA